MASAIVILVAINFSYPSLERDKCNLFSRYHLSAFVFTNLISLLPLEEPFKPELFSSYYYHNIFFPPHTFTYLLFLCTRKKSNAELYLSNSMNMFPS
jgi:hypothetical protein